MATQEFGIEKKIQADPLSTRIADAIREAIISGELRQGRPITQESIAKIYSVSTMPAREALLALSHEGMVDSQPNRGFRVARMGRQDIQDVYWAHSMLAGQLARRASERRSEVALDELEQNIAKSQAAWQASDLRTLGELEWEFHRTINVAADSPKIVALLTTAMRQIPPSFYSRLHGSPEFERVCLGEHVELVEDIRRRAPRKAEATAIKHVNTTAEAMIEILASGGFWDTQESDSGAWQMSRHSEAAASEPGFS